MTDIRTQLPECPLEYEVPLLPGSHTALVISVNSEDIEWQQRLLPWTLASLINNTDLVMQGVHLKITSDTGWVHERVKSALKRFDLPEHTCIITSGRPAIPFLRAKQYGYDAICMFDIHYWAFRGQTGAGNPEIKLPLGHVLRHNYGWGVADYNLHPMNDSRIKNGWIPTAHLRLTGFPDTPEADEKLANYFMDAKKRAHWLHDANRAVYGEGYAKANQNVAGYFFNETGEPNWHLDASLLHYHAKQFTQDLFDWVLKWRHLQTDALIALWLLKTQQHAYNLKDSLMIEGNTWEQFTPRDSDLPQYPRLCNMRYGTPKGYQHAIQHLLGAQLGISPN